MFGKRPKEQVRQSLFFRSRRKGKAARAWVTNNLKILSDLAPYQISEREWFSTGKFEYRFFTETFLTSTQIKNLLWETEPYTYQLNGIVIGRK